MTGRLVRARAVAAEARLTVRDHPRHLVLFALALGLVSGAWAPWLLVPIALVAVILAGHPGVALAAVVAVIGGGLGAEARCEAIRTGTLPARVGAPLRARMTLLEPLRERASGQLVARVAPSDGPARGEPLLLRLRSRALVTGLRVDPGDVLDVRGRLQRLDRWDVVQRRRGALAAVEVQALRETGRVRGGLAGALDGLRRRAEAGLRRSMPLEQAALLEGMVLGREDGIDPSVREAFQASGLAHLLAVSGTNVMLLSLLVLGAAGVVGVPLRLRLLVALVLVGVYVPLTGAGPSIQRAGVMGAAGLVAALAGRPASRWYALGLAAVATLALNPYAAADAGWQLSFAAVAGLLVLGTPLRQALERRRLPRPLAEAGALTVAATLATAPLLALHFERLSLVSLPANLLVAPVVAPVMWLGMLATAVAQLGPALAAPFCVLAAPLVGFVGWVASASAELPGAVVAVRLPGALGALAGYALLGVGWCVLRAAGQEAVRRGWSAPRGLVGAGGVTAAVLVLGPSALRKGVVEPRPGETVVSFLDVGQGDATLVQRDGAAVLFDTGPPEGQVVRRLRAVGLRRLDALVLTHAELDHEGTALPILEAFRPRLIVDGGAGWPSPVQRALPVAAAAVGARVVRAFAGDVLRLGRLRLAVLWPPRAIAESPPEGTPNDRALVTQVSSGSFDVLLTADAESDVTGALELPPVEALKVAHHGSEDEGLAAELELLRPQVAAIEVGRHNTYGHPTPSTLATLRRAVGHVYRTDRDGTVRLHAGAAGMSVERLGAAP